MRMNSVLVVVAVTALMLAGSTASAPQDRSSLEAQEEAVALHTEKVSAALAELDHQSLARAAHDFSEMLPSDDPAKKILAFTEAFNVAVESSLPEMVSLPVESLSHLHPDPDSIFVDHTYQANFQAVVSDFERILGGIETDGHPDCVAVGGPGRWCCTGTLVAPDRVVTAGHCFETCASRIFLGPDVAGPGEVIKVRRATRHPGYKSHHRNDLAILELERPVAGVTPAILATPEEIQAAQYVRLVGYGATDTYATEGSGKRRMVEVPITSWDCRPEDVGTKFGCDPGLELVAGAPFLDRDSCLGDSGGPAYIRAGNRWLLAGATSRGIRNSLRTCGDGGVYVRLTEYSDWLLQ